MLRDSEKIVYYCFSLNAAHTSSLPPQTPKNRVMNGKSKCTKLTKGDDGNEQTAAKGFQHMLRWRKGEKVGRRTQQPGATNSPGTEGVGYGQDHVLHGPPGISSMDPLGTPGGSRALKGRAGTWGGQKTASSGPTQVVGDTRRLYYALRLPGDLTHVAVTVKSTCFSPKYRYD